jgi:hypothetical protein
MRFTLMVLVLSLGASQLCAQSLRSQLVPPLDANVPFRVTFDEQLLDKPEVVSRGNVWIMDGENQRYDHTHVLFGEPFRNLAVRNPNEASQLIEYVATGDTAVGTIETPNDKNKLLSYVSLMTYTFGTSLPGVGNSLSLCKETGVTRQINGVETREFVGSGNRVYLDSTGVIHRMEILISKEWKLFAEVTAFATVGTKRYPSQWKTERSLFTITQVETNPEIAPETFTMNYPPGAEVTDWRNGHFAFRANSRGELELDWFRSHTIQVWALWVAGIVATLLVGTWFIRRLLRRRAKAKVVS